MNEYIVFILCGLAGALVKEVLIDNALILPKKINGKISLGFLGGLILGAVAGYITNADPVSAFLGGYAGKSIIESLVENKHIARAEKKTEIVKPAPKTRAEIEALIRRIATEQGVDPDLAVRVAVCESSLNPIARNINSPGSVDRGLFQINSHFHPHITDEMADDPEQATLFFCEAVKAGQLWKWNASRHCWNRPK